MGCLLNKTGRQQPRVMKKVTAPKEYSWDKRRAVNLHDYTVERDKRRAVNLHDYTVEGNMCYRDKRRAVNLHDYTVEGNMCCRDKRRAVNLHDYTVEGNMCYRDKRRTTQWRIICVTGTSAGQLTYTTTQWRGIKDGEVWKMPGSVHGEQLLIQNCCNARIYVLDHINSVNMDNCTNCTVVLSAVRGSVFLRECKECVCLTACGQFRTRDCWKMNVFLLCATQPIIESSTSIHMGCYQLTYTGLEGESSIQGWRVSRLYRTGGWVTNTGLEGHLQEAGLSCFNNNWSDVHDFTPVDGETNWCLLPFSVTVEDYMTVPSHRYCPIITQVLSHHILLSWSRPVIFACCSIDLSLAGDTSVVPYTWGPHKNPSGESCLVTLFCDGQQSQRVRAFINCLKQDNPACLLLQTKEGLMSPADAERVFLSSSYNQVVSRGPVVGLYYDGPNCILSCQRVAAKVVVTDLTGLVFVSNSPAVAQSQVDNFFKHAQLGLLS
uniref:Protein XRP2 n=1 Tax=Timema genevievae TaxID=629358 RepID=A0A7R9PMJ5_TIMGE|nr:unnamed protein product [Timema genevievae]